MSLNNTPSAVRLHIILLGACNSGKSSVMNLLTRQQAALVSDVAGTTTDSVSKAMELPGIGAAVFIDTAGFDDVTELGRQRIDTTCRALDKADIAIFFTGENLEAENEWRVRLKKRGIPTIEVVNKTDLGRQVPPGAVGVSVFDAERSRSVLLEAILRVIPGDYGTQSLLGNLVSGGESVMLVMPQDIQAPRGRLILPQVQVIRELLDRGCTVTCSTTDNMEMTLGKLTSAPDLIITDSQVFDKVYALKPEKSRLTSFSVLMAAYKGDIEYFIKGARAISRLTENSRVLIAEACTHAPQSEDIGRIKIPGLLRKHAGEGLKIDFVSGTDFPDDLSEYDLVIHCGACMFNRRYVLSRVSRARNQNIAMTNYGIAIANLTGILDKIVY